MTVGVRELVRQRILRLYVTGEVRRTRVGHGLDSSMDWIDWIGSSLFFRRRKHLCLVFSFVKMHFWFSSQLVIGL